MNITSGKIKSAKKVLIYGSEGIGKSTFASKFPDPLFIDTEGSTKELDVKRFDKPTSWEMLKSQINYVISNPQVCKTLVIDTFDWAESLCVKQICAAADKSGIEDFGWGNGYVYEKEEIERFLTLLDVVVEKGINICITAHAQLKKFEQPDEMGSYDRWELKLGKKTGSLISPILKEWADMVLFANYKTYAVAVDKDGKKFKAQGGKRVMYTSHHPCWDAKNRYDLPEELPFDYSTIKFIFELGTQPKSQPKETEEPKAFNQDDFEEILDESEEPSASVPKQSDIPKAVLDLMNKDGVTESEVRKTVFARGFYPEETPISQYEQNFIDGWVVPYWNNIVDFIKKNYR